MVRDLITLYSFSLLHFCTLLFAFPGISSLMNSYSNPHLWATPLLIPWSLLHQEAFPSLECGLKLWSQWRTPHRTGDHTVYQSTLAHMVIVRWALLVNHSCPSRRKLGLSWSRSECVDGLLKAVLIWALLTAAAFLSCASVSPFWMKQALQFPSSHSVFPEVVTVPLLSHAPWQCDLATKPPSR